MSVVNGTSVEELFWQVGQKYEGRKTIKDGTVRPEYPQSIPLIIFKRRAPPSTYPDGEMLAI